MTLPAPAPPKPGQPGQIDPQEFLGREFLIWLWWKSETRGGVFAVAEGQRVGIALDRQLEFHDEATGVRIVVRGDAPTRAPEAREALSRGLRLLRAGLIVTAGDENVNLVLDGESLDFRSVKGERPEGDSREEQDATALASLFGLVDSLNRVYRAFLLERFSDRFTSDIAPQLMEWASSATRGAHRAPESRQDSERKSELESERSVGNAAI